MRTVQAWIPRLVPFVAASVALTACGSSTDLVGANRRQRHGKHEVTPEPTAGETDGSENAVPNDGTPPTDPNALGPDTDQGGAEGGGDGSDGADGAGTDGGVDGAADGGTDEGTPPPPPDDTKDKEVVFGEDKVFRIGDGDFSASSCLDTIAAYPLSGTSYFFEFDVLEDDTVVDIDIKRVCGVDFKKTNVARLLLGASADAAGTEVWTGLLGKGALTFTVPQRTLAKGHYALNVESLRDGGGVFGDNDDFIVGNIRVKASKKIKPGEIRTE
jgi:hypothetical protein